MKIFVYFLIFLNKDLWIDTIFELIKEFILYLITAPIPNSRYSETKSHASPWQIAISCPHQIKIIRWRQAAGRVRKQSWIRNGVAVFLIHTFQAAHFHEAYYHQNEGANQHKYRLNEILIKQIILYKKNWVYHKFSLITCPIV